MGILLGFFLHTAHAEEKKTSIFSIIPQIIDASPTLLPEENDTRHLAHIEQTKEVTWLDRNQYRIQHWVDQRAYQIDDWFGQPDPNQPASATLRVLLDQRWNEHDGYEIEPRLRGKIILPTLEKKLSVVFGDDSLDNELRNNIAITNENAPTDQHFDGKKIRESNSSVALRWSDFYKKIPIESDLDIGLRSGDDLYLRLKLEKTWQLADDFTFNAEQIYRYGIDSENYLRSNLELQHQRPDQAMLSNQLSIIHSDQQDDDLTWQNFSFRQHQFFYGNRFNYGIYTGGFYDDHQLRLNSWGPFVSWRQPIWREWLYLQTDINYLNEHREKRDHYVGALLRLEALF